MVLCEQTLYRNMTVRVEVYDEQTWALKGKHREIMRTVIPCLERKVKSDSHELPDPYQPFNPGYMPERFQEHGAVLW
jgi:hypothetical protein